VPGKIKDLTAQIKLQTNEGEQNYLRERIAKISGGISTVLVGVTHLRLRKVARVDDAISAVRASRTVGSGSGGTALFYANSTLVECGNTNLLTLNYKDFKMLLLKEF
jgi:chaperonin GroEL